MKVNLFVSPSSYVPKSEPFKSERLIGSVALISINILLLTVFLYYRYI